MNIAIRKLPNSWRKPIWKKVTRPWTIMEICGGQTHTIVKSGLEDLLPHDITLVHGPGCPVCVTPLDLIDKAVAIAQRPEVIFCSFGDMLRVPGSSKSLFDAKAEGADVRIVYSPLDALKLARSESSSGKSCSSPSVLKPPHRPTPWPRGRPITSTSIIFRFWFRMCWCPPRWKRCSRRTIALCRDFWPQDTSAPSWATKNIFRLPSSYKVPIVVTGFEPLDILEGILMTVSQLEEGRHEVENQYARATAPRRQPPRAGTHYRSVRGREPPVARPRRNSRERLPAARAASRNMMPTAAYPFIWRTRPRVARVHQRTDSARH